jgi:hypothetical protein
VTPSGFTSVNSVVDSSYTYDRIYGQQPAEKLLVYHYIESPSPKFRNGLATAAGFAGLVVIFSCFSITPLILNVVDVSHPDRMGLGRLLLLLIPLPNMVASVALSLGVKAWRDLDAHPDHSGRIQAGFAVIIGCLGSIFLPTQIAIWWLGM